MARYNQKKEVVDTSTPNHQGGSGYKLTPKHHLVSILATGLDNSFYERLGDREQRFIDTLNEVGKVDPTFAAKALIYARSVMGQRSVTHLGAAVMARLLSGSNSIGSAFFSKRKRSKGGKPTSGSGGIVYRLDDLLEIAAAYMVLNPGKTLSNAMKKGFKRALEAADEYELAKYQAKTRNLSLVDLVNLVHPKPSEKMAPVFEKLMKGELKQFNTVEDKHSKAGQEVAAQVQSGELTEVQAQEVLKEMKQDNFMELIQNGTIGYLALVRNLRNILKSETKDSRYEGMINKVCEQLTDQKKVRASLIFPHQLDLAIEVLLQEVASSEQGIHFRKIVTALNKAYELAIPNLAEAFSSGTTAVVFDTSGSMTSPIKLSNGKYSNGSNNSRAIDKAALIAATLAKGINADVYHFDSYCNPVSFNPSDSVHTIKEKFAGISMGNETLFHTIFEKLKGKNYTRVFVISDMQGADQLKQSVDYPHTYIYSIDVCGYGTTMFKPNSKVYAIHGYSADIYEMAKKVEIDYNAVFSAIDEIEI